MGATPHLPENQPTDYFDLPQGEKNWDKPPQQEQGPEGPEPYPTPEEVGGDNVDTNSKKKPQQVDGPEGPKTPWPPDGHFTDDDLRPQQIDGPEGPEPTDGSELIEAATTMADHVADPPQAQPVGPSTKAEGVPTKRSTPPRKSTRSK